MDAKIWFPFSCDNHSDINVFCFHHAGGSASNYKEWVRKCTQVNMYSVELPGKATRRSEEPILNIEEVSVKIAQEISQISKNKKVVLFGHSMGAAIAFEVAYYLETNTHIQLQLLVAASRQAPHCQGKDKYHSSMPDQNLIEELYRLGGTPPLLLENQEFLNFVIPSIKNDYTLHESHCYKGQILTTPIIAHFGEEDPDLSIADLGRWQEVTHHDFILQKFQGGHFFLYEIEDSYLQSLEDTIIQGSESVK
ncbi:thioesterase II family protein [Lysinibacillus pakistanensis]|uniref:Thioesterase n=1 Tax=Lysinibacillus pakistanensis TaxID=759811 RepID=A0ABX6D9T5_9BACI|nr:thioesterase [Lysinibacillus pakistanensis]